MACMEPAGSPLLGPPRLGARTATSWYGAAPGRAKRAPIERGTMRGARQPAAALSHVIMTGQDLVPSIINVPKYNLRVLDSKTIQRAGVWCTLYYNVLRLLFSLLSTSELNDIVILQNYD